MSHDVTVYTVSEPTMDEVLRELAARGVPGRWEASALASPAGGGGLLWPASGGGAREAISVGWKPLPDDARKEVLASELAAGHEAALGAARRVIQLSAQGGAGAEARLGHLVEILGGAQGVVYDADEDRIVRAAEYRLGGS